MKKLVFLVLFLCSAIGFSQTIPTVLDLEITKEDCIESGVSMLGCLEDYYKQMDALLNTVYNNVRSTLSSDEKEKLKKEQLLWFKKRDKHFIELYRAILVNFGSADGEDFKMAVTDKKSEFVGERIKELVKRL
ncbi:MAG: lysozyme inhibitor LprI family protein [Flavobacterium sp.]